jgi:hypothetical protein
MSITPESLLAAGKSNDEKFELLWKRFDGYNPSAKKLLLDKIQEEIDISKKKENLKTQIESMTDSEKEIFVAKLKLRGEELSKNADFAMLMLVAITIFMFFGCILWICGIVKLFS